MSEIGKTSQRTTVVVTLVIIGVLFAFIMFITPKFITPYVEKANNYVEKANNTSKNESSVVSNYILENYKRIPPFVTIEIAFIAKQLSNKHKIPLPLIIGIMEVESGFNPTAVSKAEARGLMQVRWSVWKKVLVRKLELKNCYDLHDVSNGIEAGIVVIKYYLKESNNNLSKALYLYVGQNSDYSAKVYEAMGRFVLYEAEYKISDKVKMSEGCKNEFTGGKD